MNFQAESRCLLDAVREASAGVPFVGEPQGFLVVACAETFAAICRIESYRYGM